MRKRAVTEVPKKKQRKKGRQLLPLQVWTAASPAGLPS
jgi:hypothetical protein